MSQKRHQRPEEFLTDFLNTVPDVPEREELRQLRIERYKLIDALEFQAVATAKLTELFSALEELVIAVSNFDESIAASRAHDTELAERGRAH